LWTTALLFEASSRAVPRYGFTIGTFLQKEDPTQFQDHFYGYVINHTRSQSSCSSIITIISRLLVIRQSILPGMT
jgi:hypothetical protein